MKTMLNTNSRVKRYVLLALLLSLSLMTLSCGSESEVTQPPAAQATQPSAEQPAPAGEGATSPAKQATPAGEKTTPPTEEKTKPPSGSSDTSGLFANPDDTLDSYRMRTTMRLLEGEGAFAEGEMTTELESVREPPAHRVVMYDSSESMAMEIILIGDTTWMNMGDGTWIKSQSGTETQTAVGGTNFQADLEDILQDMAGGTKLVGQDTVNGVRCKRYTVNADFSMPVPLPEDASQEALQFLPKEMEGHIEGEIWVADQSDLPAVIVRSETTQEITLKYASRDDEKMVYEEVRDLYDINTSITIEPPEDAIEMPAMPTQPAGQSTESPGGQPAAPIEVASLDSLDSYRLDWSIQMTVTNSSAMEMGYTLEWVREPPAGHLIMGTAESPMIEYVWVGDAFWTKVGGTWVQSTEEETADAFSQMEDAMTPEGDMVLVGEETVSGIRCKHYVHDFTMIHKEIWVADQSDLPPVVIQGRARMESGQMTTNVEALVYDINTPITIEPPQ